jgi:hypothetical protein
MRTIFGVVMPTIRSGIMSGVVISLALVLGEFTISALLAFDTLQVVIYLLGRQDGKIAVPGESVYYKRIIQGGVESWKAVNPELAAEPSRNNDYQVITKAVLADRLRERLNAAGSSFRTSQLAKDLEKWGQINCQNLVTMCGSFLILGLRCCAN